MDFFWVKQTFLVDNMEYTSFKVNLYKYLKISLKDSHVLVSGIKSFLVFFSVKCEGLLSS